jgi:hypothetical protein
MGQLEELAIGYIDRVVNRRDLAGLDEMVSPTYRGTGEGWPATLSELRAFYETQQVARPDWRIDVQDAVELGDSVVLRAHAFGAVDRGSVSVIEHVGWLAHYRFRNMKIIEINLLSLVRAEPLT